MVEFAKSRGFLGYGVLPGGRNDKDSSHAVLPLAEYDELLRRIAVAERDKHEAIEQAKRTIGRERAAAEQRVREAEEAAQEQVTAMEEKLTRLKKRSITRRALTLIYCGFQGSGPMPTGVSGQRRSTLGMRWFAPWRRSTAIK